MDLFNELKAVALKQNEDGDLPAWLLEEILAVADNPGWYGDKASLIGTLKEQILNFDPYAGVGCFDTSASAEMIRATIRKIRCTTETAVNRRDD